MPNDDLINMPADVIVQVLNASDRVAEGAVDVLGPALEQRDALRAVLIDAGWIHPMPDAEDPWSLAAVDGAERQENLLAGDLLTALAVSAEGLHPAGIRRDEPLLTSQHWSIFVNHDADLDRTVKAVMHAMEIQIAASLTDRFDLVVLDGSFQTPVIAFNSALAAHGTSARSLSTEQLLERDAVQSLTRVCSHTDAKNIVSCPKSDSSTFLAGVVEERHGIRMPCTDKVLASIVLEEGEMTKSLKPTPQWAQLHIRSESSGDRDAADLAAGLDRAIDPLRRSEQGESVGITYFKPAGSSTAIKLEFKAANGREWGAQAARQLADQCAAPHLLEPYPQFLVDQWAKSIGPTVTAQLEAVRLNLAARGDGIFEYLIRSYRT